MAVLYVIYCKTTRYFASYLVFYVGLKKNSMLLLYISLKKNNNVICWYCWKWRYTA